MKILMVENHRIFAETVIGQFLSAHEVTCVSSVREAFYCLSTSLYEVVLVDFDLDDGEKGTELVQWMKMERRRELIIAMSARAEGNEALVKAGAQASCHKGRFNEIESVIESLLTKGA